MFVSDPSERAPNKMLSIAIIIKSIGTFITSRQKSKDVPQAGAPDNEITESEEQNRSNDHDLRVYKRETKLNFATLGGSISNDLRLHDAVAIENQTVTRLKSNRPIDLSSDSEISEIEIHEKFQHLEMSRPKFSAHGSVKNNDVGHKQHSTKPLLDMDSLELQFAGTSIHESVKHRQDEGATSSRDSSIPDGVRKINNFPFFNDRETVEYIRDAKVMFIMRGLPGSGKSTIVKMITEVYPCAVPCSADDYFQQPDGSYKFNRSQLSFAHEFCQEKAKGACVKSCPVIVIDNTNVKMWEMRKYADLASSFNYTVVTVQPRTPWKFNPTELAKRNKHAVDAETIRQRLRQFDEGIPLYYGWFLNEKYSDNISRTADQIFKSCQRVSPDFSYFISSLTYNPVTANKEISLRTIYGRGRSSTSTLHCTSFYANRGKDPTASVYHSSSVVQAALGKVHNLEVIGFIFTAQTAGARVKLNDQLLTLWEKDDYEVTSCGNGGRQRQSSPFKFGLLGEEGKRCDHTQGKDGKISRFRPLVGPGSRAHVTLGYISGNTAVQTGLDLVQVVECEQENDYQDESWRLNAGVLRCYSGQYWAVYLDEPISLQALFSGRY